ncbi:MAG: insulinase family protein [Proteobacteria bacterium]|nr:insulinase family protein [Pseudomonadota bacterium]
MRPLNHLLTATGVAALLAGCAAAPLDPEKAYEAAVAAAPAAPAAPGVPSPAQGGPAGQPAPAAWPVSDLKPDPGVRFGQLPNGMRYAVMRNATPAGEASFRLRVDAGSLMERDDQLGLAHFMEHMIFNGTRNVPEGEFIKRLERVGLAFGPDTNAYTSFDETVYMLELPDTRTEVVDTALLLMREAAGEATLATEAIDRERGVVLSEERTRDTPGLRMVKSQFDFLMKGQLPPKRFPIGDVSVLRTAPRERFFSFYEQYYRSENATFIAVGDFDPAEMEAKIRSRFSDWRGQGAAGVGPNLGRVAERGTEARAFVETGAPAQLTIAWMSPPELDPDTRAERREEWVESLGLAVLNRRLERISRGDNPPFISASAGHGTSLDAADQTQISVAYQTGQWRRALEAAEQEGRRAVQHGVSQRELDREITEARTSLQASVAGQATRRSPALASAIAAQVNDDDVFTAPDENLAVFNEAVRGLTAEQVNAAIKPLFEGEGPLVFVSSPQPITDADRAVAAAFNGSRQVAVAPPSAQTGKAWAYTNFGTSGRVAERREVPDLGATFVRFENGVRLTVRPSRNRKDQVLAAARIGDGELDLRRDRPSPAWVAGAALTEGGLGKLTTEEIEEALAAEVYGASFSIDDDAFVLSGGTRPEDLDTQLQVLAAYATDPGWRPQGVERLKAFAPNLHNQLEASPGGVLGRDLPRLLRSGDPRFGLPSREAMAAATLDQVRTEIGAPLSREPIEVVITGDVTVEEAIRQTAATFGALPRRTDDTVSAAATRTPFPAGTPEPVRLTHKGRPDQAVAYIAWPTDDFPSNPQDARALRVLEQVMRLRLVDEIREKQGVTYSPGTSYEAAWVYPDYGYLAASIEAPPDKLQPFFADAEKIAAGLRDAPVTADELQRAVQPRVEAIQRAQAGNEYWLGQLAGAQTDLRRLNVIREAITGLQKVTPADIQRVARQYLVNNRAYRLVVAPEARPAGAAGGSN